MKNDHRAHSGVAALGRSSRSNSFTFRASCRFSNRRCAQRRAAPEGVFLETRWSKPVPGYVNRTSETSPELVHAAYGSNYARLAETKKKYNPNSVLFINQYIDPY
jgi:hypothetical protein